MHSLLRSAGGAEYGRRSGDAALGQRSVPIGSKSTELLDRESNSYQVAVNVPGGNEIRKHDEAAGTNKLSIGTDTFGIERNR